MKCRVRTGYSLIEMVIVILIFGIIAAIAAPRVFDTPTVEEQTTTRKQLAVLRNAIEMYRTRSSVYPSAHCLPEAMGTILDGPFPVPSIGSVRGDGSVYYDHNLDEATPVVPDASAPGGWAYKPANGSIKLNVAPNDLGADW